jgi:HK97 family phage prohead protease
MLKAHTGDDGRKRLSGVASSTVRDLHGDTMAQTAILDMERAANDNLTIFLNHSYNVPEDVFGSVEKATAIQRGMDGDGNPNWDLVMDILVDDDNPRAVKAHASILKGTKLGLSIGAMIPQGGAERHKETGALTINHVHLLETSVVSIPANPRSWISNAVKALKKASLEPQDEETEKDADPEVAAAHEVKVETTVTVETADESDSSQELQQSEPEPEAVSAQTVTDVSTEAEVVADLSEAFDPAITAAVMGVSAALEATTAKLASLLDELEEEKRSRQAAEMQRDEAVLAAHTVLAEVRSIMERVGKTPVGKKTGFVQANADFSHLESVYSAPFLKLLKQGEAQ